MPIWYVPGVCVVYTVIYPVFVIHPPFPGIQLAYSGHFQYTRRILPFTDRSEAMGDERRREEGSFLVSLFLQLVLVLLLFLLLFLLLHAAAAATAKK